ncbi:hypothetical protein SPHINGOT1_270192 [Sphingomonas sp. T1]|nr:hypothetical protein SPHINGOT1_270192 [Sphingomonas sp. T1]
MLGLLKQALVATFRPCPAQPVLGPGYHGTKGTMVLWLLAKFTGILGRNQCAAQFLDSHELSYVAINANVKRVKQ